MHSVSRFIRVVRLIVSVRYPTTILTTEADIAIALFNRYAIAYCTGATSDSDSFDFISDYSI